MSSAAADQSGNHFQCWLVRRKQPQNTGERLRRRAGPFRIVGPAAAVQDVETVLSAVTAPLLVAEAAHDARQKGEQRHARRPRPRAGQRAQHRFVQQVGPRHTVGERARTQLGDRAQPQQIFLRQCGQRRAHISPRWRSRPTLFLNLLWRGCYCSSQRVCA